MGVSISLALLVGVLRPLPGYMMVGACPPLEGGRSVAINGPRVDGVQARLQRLS